MLKIFHNFIESALRNISGGVGRRLRYYYYRTRFSSCGANVQIDEGVFFQGTENISIGSDVWIDKYCIFIAGKISKNTSENTRQVGEINNIKEGELVIGNNTHIGINTIIQAHGGIRIGDYFTSSPGCKIYTLSNDVKRCMSGTYGKGEKYYIRSSILIESNVWLGINVTVLGGRIKKNSFIAPYSNVMDNIEENSFAEGNPAVKIKNRFEI